MNITKTEEGKKLTIALSGKLDTTTAPELESCIDECIDGFDEIVLDLQELDYMSSAGLRVVLKTQKAMDKKGGMKIKNVNDEIMEVFEITGFLEFLTIE